MTTAVPRQTTLEIAGFVEQVRARLADLTDEQREELLDGLEADLADQLADGAAWSDLGDPASYAAELRSAAGLPQPTRRLPRPTLPRRGSVEAVLDGNRARFEAVVEAEPWRRTAWGVVAELRPVWWLARAWVAVTLLDVVAGPWEPISVVPSLVNPIVGPLVLLAAVVLSVLVGHGRVWPGSGPDRPVVARVALVGLNVVAVLVPLSFGAAMPGYLTSYPYDSSDQYSVGYFAGRAEAQIRGLHVGPKRVTNVFAYGPGGKPIPAVQLFDQDGDPLALAAGTSTGRRADRRVPCPTFNGSTPLLNVFPLDQVALRRGSCSPGTPGRTTPTPPFAEVSPLATAGDPGD